MFSWLSDTKVQSMWAKVSLSQSCNSERSVCDSGHSDIYFSIGTEKICKHHSRFPRTGLLGKCWNMDKIVAIDNVCCKSIMSI